MTGRKAGSILGWSGAWNHWLSPPPPREEKIGLRRSPWTSDRQGAVRKCRGNLNSVRKPS